MKDRSKLLFLVREGILSAYLQGEELQEAATQSIEWSDEPRKGSAGARWPTESEEMWELKNGPGGLRYILILDSFFSDTLINPDIRLLIFERAMKGVPVKFLLADPRGPFGIARAKAIGQSAMHRSVEGLRQLALACNTIRRRYDNKWISREREIVACTKEEDWGKAADLLIQMTKDLPVEIRLYQDNPNCPLYFFSDLLIAGRFWVDHTAAYKPWEQIVDTHVNEDLYDTMLDEFYAVWNGSKPLEELLHGGSVVGLEMSNALVFISCCQADEPIVHDLERRINNASAGFAFQL